MQKYKIWWKSKKNSILAPPTLQSFLYRLSNSPARLSVTQLSIFLPVLFCKQGDTALQVQKSIQDDAATC